MRAADFLDWWHTQLGDCLPGVLKRLWTGHRPTLRLHISDARIELAQPGSEAGVAVDADDLDRMAIPDAVIDFLAGIPKPERIELKLEPGQFLWRELTLPQAARPHLAATVGYQVPKLTPFGLDEALYACGVHDDGNGADQLKAWFVAVPSARIAAAMRLLDQPLPPNPVRLDAPPLPGEPLTLRLQVTESTEPRPTMLRFAWLGVLIAWVVAGGLHVYQRVDTRQQLQSTAAQVRAEAAEVAALRHRLDQAQARLSLLNNAKHRTPSTLAMLDQLTALLDDNTWLQRLDFDGQNLTLAGNAATPAALIESLEGSATFDRVRFESLTRDESTSTDRFRIRAHLEQSNSEAAQ